ncbi:MAG: ABC transporter substrate-binding protein [Actinomycetota bacterium]
MKKWKKPLAAVVAAAIVAFGAGSGVAVEASSKNPTTTTIAPKGKVAKKIRIGYFANVTHAAALVAVQQKTFEKYFKADKTKVEFTVFNAGPAVVEAMKGGAIDVSYIGPNPAITGFATTNGTLLRIIAGSTLNGAQLVVKPSINSIADLKGKSIATPQLGNTQDVAIRAYLKKQGLTTNITGGGDVSITPTENANTLTLFKSGRLDGAWVPEPWSSRLVLEAGAKVLLDEKDIWADKKFLTTHIIAAESFLKKFPGSVESFLRAHVETVDFISKKKNEVTVKSLIQAELVAKTGKALADDVINRAWSNIIVSEDPVAKVLLESANDAVDVGLLKLGAKGVTGIYDLRILNKIRLQQNPKFKKYQTVGLGLS